MRRLLIAVAVVLVPVAGAALAQQPKSAHVAVNIADLKWGDPPPVFEKGAAFTVVSGDPGKPGIFVARLRMPAGYKINPHWHPTDEHVTVLAGTFAVGMGEKFDNATLKKVEAGGYLLLPAESRHYATAATAATVQIEAMGPFALTYVNAADDPSKRGK